MIQGTDEWHIAKLGICSGSHAIELLPGKRGGYLKARQDYMEQLRTEIIFDDWERTFTSFDMQYGIDTEPLARSAYEAITGVMVVEDGFKEHDIISGFGASPDGLVGEDGGLEIKCPKRNTHLNYLTAGVVPAKYIPQMITGMMCYNRKWWDFVSYRPDAPEDKQIFIKRLEWDQVIGDQITEEVIKFNVELTALVEKLQSLKGAK